MGAVTESFPDDASESRGEMPEKPEANEAPG